MLKIAPFTFSPIQENTYVVYDGLGHAALVDPGCYTARERDTLSQFIQTNKLNISLLLLTHGHLDHVFGLKWAAESFGLVPRIHPNETGVLAFAKTAGDMWGLPFDAYEGKTDAVKAGDELCLGIHTLEVIEVPGHSPGHVCFYNQAQHFLLGGDVLFKGSIGRTDLPGGSHEQLLKNIREKLFTLPGDTVVYPGHGAPTTIEEEREENPFFQ
jgi:glyoxylase-like metal-dependent hydrolase (beta-lactamase superfamily II)